MSIVILQLIVGSMNMVIGILAITFYSLNVGPTGITTSPTTFLQISLLVFIFGVLSFAVACLGAVPALNGRAALSQAESRGYEYYPPQITTREYVTQRRQTISEQAWAGLACPNCGRNVSHQDNFCDLCGAQFKEVPQPSMGIQRISQGIT
jgi:hypothetical protein